MYKGIPIIGIVGGIGSGKSHVARVFGEMGCHVISSDEQVTEAYAQPSVREQIRRWWGDESFGVDGQLNRRLIAAKVFSSEEERRRLEALIHPVVAQLRDVAMHRVAEAPKPPVAFVWDTPLLFEAGLAVHCDAVVFVDAPVAVRDRRVREKRGWAEGELRRRENSQWPLDKKRALSHYVVTNAAETRDSSHASYVPAKTTDIEPPEVKPPELNPRESADQSEVDGPSSLRRQIRSVLSSILTAMNERTGRGEGR